MGKTAEPLPAYEEFSTSTIDDYPTGSAPQDLSSYADVGPPDHPPPKHPPPGHFDGLPNYYNEAARVFSEASTDECDIAIAWLSRLPLMRNPIGNVDLVDHLKFKLVAPPAPALDRLSKFSTAKRFKGQIRTSINDSTFYITSNASTQDCCFISNLPVYNPLQDIHEGKMYYECLVVQNMDHSTSAFAIGYSVLPYPPFRLPGWHRGSVAIHSDDGNMYFSDDQHGQSCTGPLNLGDTVGLGLDLETKSLVITRNGRLHVQLNIANQDRLIVAGRQSIYACVGIYGSVGIQVNFGQQPFKYDFFGKV